MATRKKTVAKTTGLSELTPDALTKMVLKAQKTYTDNLLQEQVNDLVTDHMDRSVDKILKKAFKDNKVQLEDTLRKEFVKQSKKLAEEIVGEFVKNGGRW